MRTESHAIPDDIRKKAEAVTKTMPTAFGWRKITDEVAKAINAERERCARLIEEGYERGIARKVDMCAHSKFKWEDCDECAVAAIRAAPKAEG